MDIFAQAAKVKLRFPSKNGNLSTENLFELPFTQDGRRKEETVSLEELELAATEELKTVSTTGSYVSLKLKKPTAESVKAQLLKLRLDIIKAVIDIRAEENEAKDTEEQTRAHNRKIDALIAKKEENQLENLSVEELRALKK